MTTLRFSLAILLLSGMLTGCKNNNGTTPVPTAVSQTELLVANNWRISRVSTPDGQSINRSRLSLTNQILFDLNMQFRANGTVRALDPNASNEVRNAGTWVLALDSKSMDVVVTGFRGNFPIVNLSRTKLVLRQRAPVDGKDADINLEFDPSL